MNLPAYAHNPCIKKGGGITTTIIDLQILHLDSKLPKNQNKASFLSLLSYCIENTDLTITGAVKAGTTTGFFQS
jgi:hypothetical protein